MEYIEKALRMKPDHPLCLQAKAEVSYIKLLYKFHFQKTSSPLLF